MKAITTILSLVVLLGVSISAHAVLVTVGTATYGGSDYNLIWDDDNNGNSVIWLDYTNSDATWSEQMDWAAGLGSTLTYNFDKPYLDL